MSKSYSKQISLYDSGLVLSSVELLPNIFLVYVALPQKKYVVYLRSCAKRKKGLNREALF